MSDRPSWILVSKTPAKKPTDMDDDDDDDEDLLLVPHGLGSLKAIGVHERTPGIPGY